MSRNDDTTALRARVDLLEHVVGAMYQFAGEVGAPVRMLDALWAVSQGKSIDVQHLTRVYKDECEEIITLKRQLDDVRKIVAIGSAASEFGRLGGSRTSDAKRRASAANGRKGGRPRKTAAA